MQAALLYGIKDLRIEERPIPIIGPGEVLVRVETALTCGTDLKTFQRGHPVLLRSVPSPFGHEFAGTVVEVGEGVEQFAPGVQVTGGNSAPCRQCFYCQLGKVNLCENLTFLQGTYAEYLRVPAAIVRENLLPIPANLSPAEAAFCEPLACVLYALDQVTITPGEEVALLGSGAIALMFLQVLRQRGAKVFVVGRSYTKLALAQQLNADAALSINDSPDPVAAIRALSHGGRGVGIVIEAIGQPTMWEQALQMTRKAGQVLLFGGCPKGTSITVDTEKLHYEEQHLIGVFHHTPAHIRAALDWLATKRVSVAPLLSKRLPLSRLPQAFEEMRTGKAFKIAIDPSQDGVK